jgi:hypothetical protein
MFITGKSSNSTSNILPQEGLNNDVMLLIIYSHPYEKY